MNNTTQHPEDLLPFYVNNTLSDEEYKQVEAHVSNCEYCQHELILLRTMHKVSQTQAEFAPEEFAWQRLKRDIKQKNSVKEKESQWWKPALATAAAIIIVLQTTFIISKSINTDSYTQAGHHEKSAVVQVKFNPNTREEQMRSALLEIDAEIIAGPSALGIYKIKISHLQSDPKTEEKIKKLKNNKLLINYIARE